MNKLAKLTLAAFVLSASLPPQISLAEENNHSKEITVFKTPWCGCCQIWVEAMESAGYLVTTRDMEDLSAIKKQGGVPEKLQACHTAVTGDDRKYILEGHLPLESVNKLMTERPDIRGIAVPGMPAGSLGMGYDPNARYTVFSFGESQTGEPAVFLEAGG